MPPSLSRLDDASHRGATCTLVLFGAALAALAGAVLLTFMLAQPRLKTAEGREPLEVGGLILSVQAAGWVGHDMSSMSNMPMGAPEDMPADGHRRLHAEVLLSNDTGAPIPLSADDFRLVSEDGQWPPRRATLPASGLSVGQSVLGDLYFEVPDDTGADGGHVQLTMTRGGKRALVSLPLSGPMPDHERSPQ